MKEFIIEALREGAVFGIAGFCLGFTTWVGYFSSRDIYFCIRSILVGNDKCPFCCDKFQTAPPREVGNE